MEVVKMYVQPRITSPPLKRQRSHTFAPRGQSSLYGRDNDANCSYCYEYLPSPANLPLPSSEPLGKKYSKSSLSARASSLSPSIERSAFSKPNVGLRRSATSIILSKYCKPRNANDSDHTVRLRMQKSASALENVSQDLLKKREAQLKTVKEGAKDAPRGAAAPGSRWKSALSLFRLSIARSPSGVVSPACLKGEQEENDEDSLHSLSKVSNSSPSRWPRAPWRRRSVEGTSASEGLQTIENPGNSENTSDQPKRTSLWYPYSSNPDDITNVESSVKQRGSSKTPKRSFLWSSSPNVDETKLDVFDVSGGELSPLSPSSAACSSTRVVLSRGVVEYPDVELRDTSCISFSEFTSNTSSTGDPLLPVDTHSSLPNSVLNWETPQGQNRHNLEVTESPASGLRFSLKPRIFTVMGRLKTGVNEKSSDVAGASTGSDVVLNLGDHLSVGEHSFSNMEEDVDRQRLLGGAQPTFGADAAITTDLQKQQRFERLLRRSKTEDLREISGIGCLYHCGHDKLGRPVIVFIGKWFKYGEINLDKALLYLLQVLEPISHSDYVIIYFHTLTATENHPALNWIRHVYDVLLYRHKKHLKAFYIVHPTLWTKIMTWWFTTFMAPQIKHKVFSITGIEYLYDTIEPDQLEIPAYITEHDMTVNGLRYYKSGS